MTKAWIALLGCSLVAACTEEGRLRVDSKLAESSAALTTAGSSSLELAGGTLVISRARISVSEIEFEGGDEDDELEAELGSATIELALDGGLTPVAADSVEAGRYHTLGLELRGGGSSILVEGTYSGQPFSFTSGLAPELEFPLRPEVDVPPDGEASVGVLFDVAAWFTAGDGSVLDPLDAANQGVIEGNILASMAANAEIEQGDDD